MTGSLIYPPQQVADLIPNPRRLGRCIVQCGERGAAIEGHLRA